MHKDLDSLGAQGAEEGPRSIVSLKDTTQKQEDGEDDHGDDKDRDKGAVQLGEGRRVVFVGGSGTLFALG